MARLTLSFVTGTNERVNPLVEGVVQPEGVELIPTLSDPSETFWRQLNFEEFEISEMSLSSFLIARARGMDMMAIPVFPSRRFMHTQLSYHADSGITRPEDITGKRIGVGEYQQTAALWTRGILGDDRDHHRLLARAGADQREGHDRGPLRAQHAGLVTR